MEGRGGRGRERREGIEWKGMEAKGGEGGRIIEERNGREGENAKRCQKMERSESRKWQKHK
jgi:hypothetical protein